TVDWSCANGGDLKLVCDNPKFTFSPTIIADVDNNDGTTDIAVTYTPTEVGKDEATLIIYNDVYRKEVKLTGAAHNLLGTVTPTDTEYYTFGATEKFIIPEGITAYVGAMNAEQSKVTLTEVAAGETIEGGQGILFNNATPNTTYRFYESMDEPTAIDNVLKGSSSQTPIAGSTNTFYAVSKKTVEEKSVVAFFKVDKTKVANIPAHKAYMELTGESSISVLYFGDEETVIEQVESETAVMDGTIYNVAGQRLNGLQRGINIVNGKKVLK
ncbi:MAG: hypothetical protein HUK03_07750, partial [Bacteroidaceae bacterium]|nr:hypothetical protein [Bacteroidaceae bacterium]